MAFGWYLEALLVVQSCFCYTYFCHSELDLLEVFQKAIVVVALCTSHTHLRHFTSQLNVSTTSGCLECVDVLFLSHGSHVVLTCLFAWLYYFRVYPATVDFRGESLQNALG